MSQQGNGAGGTGQVDLQPSPKPVAKSWAPSRWWDRVPEATLPQTTQVMTSYAEYFYWAVNFATHTATLPMCVHLPNLHADHSHFFTDFSDSNLLN